MISEDTVADEDLPQHVASPPLPQHLQDLTERAREYVEASSASNTRKAYASDWKHFSAWCRRSSLAPLPPHPQTVGLYITACASGTAERGMKANAVSTIERRLSSLSWSYAQRGLVLDRKDRHIATVMAGIRNSHARPPVQKEAVMADDIIAMLETLDRGTLRGMRDRAMLLIGYAGGLRRSEIVGLDLKAHQTEDGRGWIDILDKGVRTRAARNRTLRPNGAGTSCSAEDSSRKSQWPEARASAARCPRNRCR